MTGWDGNGSPTDEWPDGVRRTRYTVRTRSGAPLLDICVEVHRAGERKPGAWYVARSGEQVPT